LEAHVIEEFTAKTGISVRFIPGSESASRRLDQERTLLRHQSSAVDVYQIDTIWPAILADDLIDLKPALGDDLEAESPQLVGTATVHGRIVAAPFLVEYGVLFYRKDLVHKYGFTSPPRTWDELETQAGKIQQGERAEGTPDFWGYVWQGADYEGLTCNALEWQSSQGGGNLIEPDRTVDVANEAAIKAFARAAQWVGTISPPGVTAYLEEDSRNVWQSGRAAFMRNWSSIYAVADQAKAVKGRFAMAPMPAGADVHSSVLGGWYLGISKYSRRSEDAIAFVRYMSGKGLQRERAVKGGVLPTFASLYSDPGVLGASGLFAPMADVPKRLIERPTAFAGAKYDQVSRAYADGVHEILTRKATAPEAAAKIQSELKHLTGFADSRPVLMAGAGKEQR
jgi:trehalose/maltose transport system substrate-binding protein